MKMIGTLHRKLKTLSVRNCSRIQLTIGRKTDAMNCSECAYYYYDEDDEAYYCFVDMDEDDYARIMVEGRNATCPFYRNGDDYVLVRHQM